VLFPYIRAACRLESYLEAVGDFARRWAALRSCDSPNPVPTITSTPVRSTDSNPTSGKREDAPFSFRPSSDWDDLDDSDAAASGDPWPAAVLARGARSLRRTDSDLCRADYDFRAASECPSLVGPVDSDGDAAPPTWLLPGIGNCGGAFIIGGGWALPAGSGLFAPPPLLRQAAATFGPSALAAALNAGHRVDRRPSGPAGLHPPPQPAAAACFSHYPAL
jgi:hypothetical protein